MKTLQLSIMCAICTVLLTASSCESNEERIGTEVTIVEKNAMSFGWQNGGKDTIRIKNEGTINIYGIWVYDATKNDTELCRTMLGTSGNSHPNKIETNGIVYGTIEYDNEWNVSKITIDQYTVKRVYKNEGTKGNEYEVSVSPSNEPRKYYISIGVNCKRDSDFIIPTNVTIR